MKTTEKIALLVSMAVLLVTMPASAQSQPSTQSVPDDTCSLVAQMARTVMQARQAGMQVEDAYKPAYSDWMKRLIVDAYSEARYQTAGFQQQSIDEFTTRNFVACMKGDQ